MFTAWNFSCAVSSPGFLSVMNIQYIDLDGAWFSEDRERCAYPDAVL
jgi:hypothetical protein